MQRYIANDRRRDRSRRFTVRFGKDEWKELVLARRLNDLRSFDERGRLGWNVADLSGLMRTWSLAGARLLVKAASAADLKRAKRETRTL